MRFCLISGKAGEDVKQIILEEAKKKFDQVLYVPIDKIRIDCHDGKNKVMFKSTDISEFDAVFLRAFDSDFLFAELILENLESAGVYVQNSLDGYQVASSKFYTVQQASRIGVPVPDSSMSIMPEKCHEIALHMGFPVVLKLLQGFGGKGVMLVKSEEELKPILDTLKVFDEFLSIQKFIPNARTDVRGLVIGDEVIGIRRKGAKGEWRANVSTGGSAEIVELDDNTKEISLKTAELFGMEISAVDFIETAEEPRLIEINFSPGIMKDIFGSELAAKMINHIYKKASESKVEVLDDDDLDKGHEISVETTNKE